MGYSCTAKASLTEEGVRRAINAKLSNAMPDGGFYEIGQVQDDGRYLCQEAFWFKKSTDAQKRLAELILQDAGQSVVWMGKGNSHA